jgi:hypothetical protein
MARPKKSNDPPKQGPPVAFRAGPDLSQLVARYAGERQVSVHEAFKNLAALATVGLDVRYYDLVAELAGRMNGLNPFVRAVLQLNDALLAAVRVDPGYAFDPPRTAFVIDTVRVRVAAAGGSLRVEVVRELLTRLGIQTHSEVGNEPASEESAFHTTNYGRQKEEAKVRISDE